VKEGLKELREFSIATILAVLAMLAGYVGLLWFEHHTIMDSYVRY